MERKFKVSFMGRKVGAIGVRYHIDIEVISQNEDDIIAQIYAKYEHISHLSIIPL